MESRALLFKTARTGRATACRSGRSVRRIGRRRWVLFNRPFAVDVERPGIAVHYSLGDDHLLDPVEAGQVEHRLEQDRLHDGAEAAGAGLALDGALRDRGERIGVEVQLDVLHLEEPLVLLDQRVLRLGQDLHERDLVEVLERRHDRQPADEFRDQAELQRSSGSTRRNSSPVLRSSGDPTVAPKPIDVLRPRSEMILSRPEKAPPQMNRMLVVSTCRNSCCGCLRPPCGGTLAIVPSMIFSSACCTPSPDTSRVIDGLSDLRRDLVDLVDVDDAALRALDIVIGRLQQLQDDVLDVLADIAGFGQRRRIGHGEGHVEDARERLREQRLAAAGRADQQDVGLGQLDVVVARGVVEPLVVIVDGDREDLLGVVLPIT